MKRYLPLLTLVIGIAIGAAVRQPPTDPIKYGSVTAFEILSPDTPIGEHAGVKLQRFSVYRVNDSGPVSGTIDPPSEAPSVVTLKTRDGLVAFYGTPIREE